MIHLDPGSLNLQNRNVMAFTSKDDRTGPLNSFRNMQDLGCSLYRTVKNGSTGLNVVNAATLPEHISGAAPAMVKLCIRLLGDRLQGMCVLFCKSPSCVLDAMELERPLLY